MTVTNKRTVHYKSVGGRCYWAIEGTNKVFAAPIPGWLNVDDVMRDISEMDSQCIEYHQKDGNGGWVPGSKTTFYRV